MARRRRPLVPQLWQRELGIRQRRPDAPAHRHHQRSSYQGERTQVSLAAWPPPRRSPVFERSRFLGGIMDSVHTYASDIAFTASVKAIQTRKGSRRSYTHMEERAYW